MGRIQCQALMGTNAWLPCVFPIMWPEASDSRTPWRTAESPLTVGETGQASAGMGLCTHMMRSLNKSPSSDKLIKSWRLPMPRFLHL